MVIDTEELNGKILYTTNFIIELIKKYKEEQVQLKKNLDQYFASKNNHAYDKTFSSWNKNLLFINDLEDILCRMGYSLEFIKEKT